MNNFQFAATPSNSTLSPCNNQNAPPHSRRSVCFSRLILPHHGDDAAQDRALAAVDGLVVGVRGHEPDLAALARERFDRRLVTKQRDHDLPVVAPDCPAAEMIHAISMGGLGLIVICEGERIEGIVTDGDVRRAMERLRGEFFNIRASDIATRNPKTISPDEKLIEAEKMMTRNKVTSLLVTDAAGKLTGVIQIYDIKL